MKKLGVIAGMAFLFSAAPPALAQFDGSKPLHCTATEVQECDQLAGCERRPLEVVDLPQFIEIDFKAKQVSGVRPSGVEARSAVESIRKLDDVTILQGSDTGRAWSLVIEKQSGRLTASAIDHDAGFLVFAVCESR